MAFQVKKKSNKPFKSKRLVNTVKGECINPHSNKEAYTFFEDDSIVDKHICEFLVCDHCGTQSSDVYEEINPYMAEINGVEVKEYLCGECIASLIQDI